MLLIKRNAPAKINLTLKITGQREDGYHLLSSIVAFIDLSDSITLKIGAEPDAKLSLPPAITFGGEFAHQIENEPIAQNLIAKAIKLLASTLKNPKNLPSLAVHLNKHIPSGAGLGGGSSDAAASLIALREVWKLPLNDQALINLSITLGADLPALIIGNLHPQPLLMEGIGEILTPLAKTNKASEGFPASVLPASVLIVFPNLPLSTAACFKAYHDHKTTNDEYAKSDAPLFKQLSNPALTAKEFASLLATSSNDLESAAINIVPEIGNLLAEIRKQKDCLLARMSGSGSACFGIFEKKEACSLAVDNLQKLGYRAWACRFL